MTDTPDADLLERYARDNSEPAFAALVERHIALVHFVAVRHTANPQSAQDITQAVLIILARKAAALNRKTILPGWLYHTARLTAANSQRAETRRIRREKEAYMQSTLQESAPDATWAEMSPLIDEAMSHLGTRDRDALVLRYFQNKSLLEVGAARGLEERTAQKGVTRALEKLRKFFVKRGVTLTATAIAGAVSANSVQAAPVALVKTITATAIVKGSIATASTMQSFAIPAGTFGELTGELILTNPQLDALIDGLMYVNILKLGLELEVADNAWAYIVEYTALPNGATKTATFTNAHEATLTGLVSATMYSMRAQVMGSGNQVTEWSNTVQQMAT